MYVHVKILILHVNSIQKHKFSCSRVGSLLTHIQTALNHAVFELFLCEDVSLEELTFTNADLLAIVKPTIETNLPSKYSD